MASTIQAGAKVKVGVLGAGAWAEFAHLPGYKRDPRCELVAIADPLVERAQAPAPSTPTFTFAPA